MLLAVGTEIEHAPAVLARGFARVAVDDRHDEWMNFTARVASWARQRMDGAVVVLVDDDQITRDLIDRAFPGVQFVHQYFSDVWLQHDDPRYG